MLADFPYVCHATAPLPITIMSAVSLSPVWLSASKLFLFFFFQAEDGIRDTSVTGVQTCAFRSEGRCAGDPVRQEGPQGAGLDQGAGSRRGEGGDRAVRLLRFGGDAGRYSRHRAQEPWRRQVSCRLLVSFHQGPRFRPGPLLFRIPCWFHLVLFILPSN